MGHTAEAPNTSLSTPPTILRRHHTTNINPPKLREPPNKADSGGPRCAGLLVHSACFGPCVEGCAGRNRITDDTAS
eukprot:6597056-Alexandrium_andersonii.AAC.1